MTNPNWLKSQLLQHKTKGWSPGICSCALRHYWRITGKLNDTVTDTLSTISKLSEIPMAKSPVLRFGCQGFSCHAMQKCWRNPEQPNPKWPKSQQLNPNHKDLVTRIQLPCHAEVLQGHRWTECHGEWILSNQIPNDWNPNNWIPIIRIWSLGIQSPCCSVVLKS